MPTNNERFGDLAHTLLDWFEAQGLTPEDACKVMAISLAAMSKGSDEVKILLHFNALVQTALKEIETVERRIGGRA